MKYLNYIVNNNKLKNNIMANKFEIWTRKQRLSFIQKEMGDDKVKIIKEDPSDGTVKVEVTLDNEYDVLNLFHAGINYGLDRGSGVTQRVTL